MKGDGHLHACGGADLEPEIADGTGGCAGGHADELVPCGITPGEEIAELPRKFPIGKSFTEPALDQNRAVVQIQNGDADRKAFEKSGFG